MRGAFPCGQTQVICRSWVRASDVTKSEMFRAVQPERRAVLPEGRRVCRVRRESSPSPAYIPTALTL